MNNHQNPNIIVCDLDGTLIKTDVFLEGFLQAVSINIKVLLVSVIRLVFSGIPASKRYLADNTDLNIETLPVNEQVLVYLRKKKQSGHRLFLISAADHKVVNKIADHLEIFEEAHGSFDEINLKGKNKAEFLVGKFGEESFEYIGDSRADFHIWKISAKATAVGFSESRLYKLKRVNSNTTSIDSSKSTLRGLTQSLRLHQWVKNLLVFAPPALAHNFEVTVWLMAIASFFSLSLLASGTYIFNDLLDLQSDRKHPSKRYRAIPSGKVSLLSAGSLGFGLGFAGLFVASLLSPALMLVLTIYLVVTILYSILLKTKIIVDVVTLSFLFTLRIFAGSVATGIETTPWLFAFSIFFFLMLATCKRMQELTLESSRVDFEISRRPYDQGDKIFLISFAVMSGQLSVLVYTLYINSDYALLKYPNIEFLWIISLILIYWVGYVIVKTYRGIVDDDPIKFVFKSKFSWCCGTAIVFLLLLAAA